MLQACPQKKHQIAQKLRLNSFKLTFRIGKLAFRTEHADCKQTSLSIPDRRFGHLYGESLTLGHFRMYYINDFK